MTLPTGVYLTGNGSPVVLLHSSLSSAKQWQPLVAMLSPHFTVINIDLLGYGEAEAVRDKEAYNFSVEINRINAILKDVIKSNNYHLVGHSCGGAIALKLAVENPESILSLSLFEPVAFHLLANGKERQLVEDFASRVNTSDKAKAAEIFTDFWNSTGFYLSLPEKIQAKMAADMDKVNLDFKGLINETYTLNELRHIKSQVFYMLGDKSPNLSHHLANLICSNLPYVTEKRFTDGHMAPISSYEKVQTAIYQFILKEEKLKSMPLIPS